MNIQLSDDWRITKIPRNWVLQKRTVIQESHLTKGKKSRAGESKWVDVGYYGSLHLLADALPDEVALLRPPEELSVLIKAMRELTSTVKSLEVVE